MTEFDPELVLVKKDLLMRYLADNKQAMDDLAPSLSSGKRHNYTETVAKLETHLLYTREHLSNIDTHLGGINSKVANHENRLVVIETEGKPKRKLLNMDNAKSSSTVASLLGIIYLLVSNAQGG